MSLCYYLAIDPGNTSGWAAFNQDGSDNSEGYRTSKEALYDVMKFLGPKVIICEDFRIKPSQATNFIWSRLPTVKLIGGIEHYCWDNNVQLFLNSNTCKPAGYAYADRKVRSKSDPVNHQDDAYAHGIWWLVENKIRKSKGQTLNDLRATKN